ncbi:MAG TPA: hypothetical protein VFW07_21450 [Parafilimonas sp.]|nr:hypothetical protein [Parafilimonas sp.]
MIISNTMIKEFIILRPADFPYRLMSLVGYFYNDHHLMNFYHAAGMELMYEQQKICYAIDEDNFYQLLKLKNTQEPHEAKYNWLVLKGIFGMPPGIEAQLKIENEEVLSSEQKNFFKKLLPLHRMIERGDELAIHVENDFSILHHFKCNDVFRNNGAFLSTISVTYLGTYDHPYSIINLWFDEENKLMPMSLKNNHEHSEQF